jgi:threonine aldolase
MSAPRPPGPGAPAIRVDLYSDTRSRPTEAMRQAMMVAEVGDEQAGLDPTVNALCARVASLLGKQAAMFLPSGTMCNEIAILTHCRPGDEVLAHADAHIITAEGGAPAALAGVRVHPLAGDDGQFEAEAVHEAAYARGRYTAPRRLVCAEQTANVGGGAVWPLARLGAVAAAARAAGMATHMDGARLFNATVASAVSPATMVAGWDSVFVDFTKGLGAPIGAVLAGSSEFIDDAWRWKQRLGGAMRQAGIAAAGCLFALDHHVARLAEDHRRAARLAAALALVPGLRVAMPPTNLVYVDVRGLGCDAAAFAARAGELGVAVSVMGRFAVRAVTYLDIDDAAIETAITLLGEAAATI